MIYFYFTFLWFHIFKKRQVNKINVILFKNNGDSSLLFMLYLIFKFVCLVPYNPSENSHQQAVIAWKMIFCFCSVLLCLCWMKFLCKYWKEFPKIEKYYMRKKLFSTAYKILKPQFYQRYINVKQCIEGQRKLDYLWFKHPF